MRIAAAVSCALAFGSPALAAPPGFHDAVAASGAVLHYKLNETSGFAKNSGSLGVAYDGEYGGSPTRGIATQSGDEGVHFNTMADFMFTTPSAPAGLTGNPDFTAEAIFRLPTAGESAFFPPLLHWGGVGAGVAVYFALQGTWAQHPGNLPNKLMAGFYQGGLESEEFLYDVWYHYVWVRDSGGGTNNAVQGTTVYLNGRELELVADASLCCSTTIPNVAQTIFTVNRAADFATTRLFEGDLDELALYDRALSGDEVRAHAAAAFLLPIPATPTPLGPLLLAFALLLGSALVAARRRLG